MARGNRRLTGEAGCRIMVESTSGGDEGKRKGAREVSTARISNIQGYSIHDGPGIRTTVFLQGCPLRCRWCANPENLSGETGVGFFRSRCAACGRCASACPRGAVLPGPDRRIDRAKCDRCGLCAEACPHGALVRYGQERTAREVFEEVRKDKMFYDASGGGVTVSGGEPLTRAEFVSELFALCRAEGISTCVETCGCVPRSAVERVLPLTDLFYFDLKLMDPEKHRAFTGRDNALILDNARFLAGLGAELLFRQPLIPGVNDGEEDVRACAAFLRGLGREDLGLQLMPYHRLGVSKYEALDEPYSMPDTPVMPPEEIERVRSRYESLGVRCTVSK